MPQGNNSGTGPDGGDLGPSFERSESPSYGGREGSAFAEHNSDPHGPLDEQRSKRKRWYWIVAILLLVLVLFLVHHYSGDTTQSGGGAAGASGSTGASGGRGGRGQTGPASITIGQTKTGDINIYVDALGTVTPTATVSVYSQITGRVMAVHYKEGQLVRKGDPLVDIDPRPSEATLQQAKGQLTHDEGVLAEARIDLARYQAAYAKNAIARQQLEDQEQIVKQDEGTVEADKGTVAGDEVQLSYCHIVSPISGRVGLRLVDPGNTVFSGSSSTLAVITQLQPMTVVFNVSEDNLPAVQQQLRGHVLEVDAYDRSNATQLETGKLTSLDNQVDTTTGTVKFRATFANKNMELFPNQFVNARLLLKTLQNAVLVPTAAVQHNGTAAFVYVVGPGKNGGQTVKTQPITTQTSNDDVTAAQGINAGVTVATSGFDRLDNNVPVRVAQKGQRGANGASGASGSSGSSGPGGASGSSGPGGSSGGKGKGGHGGPGGATSSGN